jgi:hypothetical protein
MARMSELNPALITSRSEFTEAIRAALREAADQGGRAIVMSDPDFADWPLNEREAVECLGRWAQSHRSLTLLANDFDEFPRKHARWVAWRQNWSHIVSCRQADETDAPKLPIQLLIPGKLVVRLVDRVTCRGSVSRAEADLVQAREAINDILDRSHDAFPVTTLGL